MKNSYLFAGAIVLIAILTLVFNGRKIEAPLELNEKSPDSAPMIVGKYKLDVASSTIGWRGEFLTGMSEEGTLMLTDGIFEVKDNNMVEGEFTIDMNSFKSIPYKDKLVDHLKSDDFFSVKTYPTAKLVLKSMSPSSEEGAKNGRYLFVGDLTIKDITKSVSFIATITEDGNQINAEASFAINRADWNIKYNSATFFSNLGDKVIRDAVNIKLDLIGTKVIQ